MLKPRPYFLFRAFVPPPNISNISNISHISHTHPSVLQINERHDVALTHLNYQQYNYR